MFDKPKKVIHFGDVHLFFSKKFEDHEYVFNEFYKKIEEEKPDLFVCAGDLIDSKTKLSGEQLTLARNFIYNLTCYCPLIIILGNHDLNLANKEKEDLLTPIISSLNSEVVHPIHFFKHSGVYDLYNIKWAIWSCLDDQKKPEIKKEIDDYVIGLYHGAVKGCISDNGFILSEGIDIKEFDDTNITMLADIHKRQSFRNGEIVYSGSLIQTKISEPENGSFVVWEWDGEKYNYKFKDIKNIYSTISINASNLKELKPTNEKQLIIVNYDSNIISKTDALSLRKELQAKYPNKFELKPSIKHKDKSNNLNKEKIKVNLQNALKDYLIFLKFSTDEIKNIIDLDLSYSNNLDLSLDFEPGDFSLCWLEMSNFLAFSSEIQIIDFNKEGIIGISGKNRVGKSSILKAIMFCLYNSSVDNNSSLKKLINKHNRNDEAFVNLILYKAGKYYKISRSLSPKKKEGVTIFLEFYEVDEFGNELKSLTGEKRQDTEKEIQKYFGLESAFEILSLYSAQKRQQELIDCKNAERLKLINRFIGSNNYEIKYATVLEDLKIKKGIYQSILSSFNQTANLTKMEKELDKLEEKEFDLLDEISNNKESETIFEFKNRHLISNYETTKKIASKIVSNPEKAKEEILELEKEIIKQQDLKTSLEENIAKRIESLKAKKEEFLNKYSGLFGTNVGITKFKVDYKLSKPIESEIAVLNSDISRLQKQMELDNCMSCGRVMTEEDKLQKRKDLIPLMESLDGLNKKLKLINGRNEVLEQLIENYSDEEDKLKIFEDELKLVENKIFSLKTQIENIQLKSKDWDEVEQAKLKLIDLEKEYSKYLSFKKDSFKILEMLQNNIGAVKTEIKILEKEITTYNTQYNKLQEAEKEMNLLKLYKDIINKDGLPLFILQSKLNEINEQVNLVVSQVFDFELEFSINEGDLNIDFFYENDEEKNDVGFASGSETFIINLCIKVGLSQISELPKLTSLLIDEGYGTLDADSLSKIPSLFTALPEYYKNIITVSHIDELKDLYNYDIKLQKVGKYTQVI